MNCLVCNKELIGKQRKYCSRRCERIAYHRKSRGQAINVRPRRSHLEWSDEDIQNRINTKSSKIIYCGGYTNSKSPMYVYCDDCGQPFKWNAKGLRERDTIRCDNCRHLLFDIRKKERVQEIQERKETKQQEIIQRRKEEKALREMLLQKTCQRCGKKYKANKINQLYCSTRCRNRQHDANKEHLRRLRIKNGNHDNISTILLAERDNNICWLCKKKVDWNDFIVNDKGNFLSGQNYPSQDHVIPLANGGSHTWDNVRLAHCKCNTEKGASLFGKKKNGQVILFC